jgi:hypothetical protein
MSLLIKQHDAAVVKIEGDARALISNDLPPDVSRLIQAYHDEHRVGLHLIIYIRKPIPSIVCQRQHHQFRRGSEGRPMASCLKIAAKETALNHRGLTPVGDTETEST